jgi:hypothetical protein
MHFYHEGTKKEEELLDACFDSENSANSSKSESLSRQFGGGSGRIMAAAMAA